MTNLSYPLAATHPAPLAYVPRRGRNPRLDFARLSTPVRIPEVAEKEMPLVGHVLCGTRRRPVLLHAGSLWTPIPGEGGGPMSLGALAELLADDAAEATSGHAMPDVLVGSPLHVLRLPLGRRTERGIAVPDASVGDVLEDGRGRAPAAVAGWARTHLAVRGGIAFARLPGPFAVPHLLHDRVEYVATGVPVVQSADDARLDGLVDIRAAARHHDFLNGGGLPHAVSGIALEEGLDLARAPDAIRLAVNKGLLDVIRTSRAMVRAAGEDLRDPGAVEAAGTALGPFVRRARVGGVAVSEAGEVMGLMESLLRAGLARCPYDAKGRGAAEAQLDVLTTYLIPSLPDPGAEATVPPGPRP